MSVDTKDKSTLVIGGYCEDGFATDFMNSSNKKSIKKIIIDESCYRKEKAFIIDGWEILESIVIGRWCFSEYEGMFIIRNCPKLREIRIDDHSFENYCEFKLENLHLLREINIGNHCFRNVKSFSLTGNVVNGKLEYSDFEELTTFWTQSDSFHYCQDITFESK